jgi:hypothetical protein
MRKFICGLQRTTTSTFNENKVSFSSPPFSRLRLQSNFPATIVRKIRDIHKDLLREFTREIA